MKPIAVLAFIFYSFIGYSQLRQIPIQHPPATQPANARIQEVTPISLPFWDDFSTSSGSIDTTWWMPSSQVQVIVKPGIGILPPTLNVVTFDGIDANGNPYSTTNTDGPVDSLVSRPIDLTLVPNSLKNTVYLSFFFQVRGLGNQPEPQDSLLLYFRKSDGTWQKMWPLVNDPIPQDPTIFTEKLVHVPNDTTFFYDKFQFKFQALGRQNGWFDNWHIDYIYMDKRRHANDNSYLDRAFTNRPSSFLNGYTAIPFNEFFNSGDPSSYLTSTDTWIRTLENDTQPIQFTAIVTDTLNHVVLDTIANFQELLLFAKDIKQAVSAPPDASIFNPTADSLYLEIKYYAQTGDKNLIDSIYNVAADTAFYPNIDLKVNDTTRSYVTIKDYFAYDDGTAEFGAGVNQKDGRIAYQFVTNHLQYIDRVDAYFPNISRNQAGSPMEIFILKDLQNDPSTLLGLTTGAIQHTGINEFVSYNFATSISVQDTFYVAFRNLADDGLWTAIGLDKNTNAGDKIYYNVDGSWVQNTSIEGSLMLRPHFVNELVTGFENQPSPVEVYPNPTQGRLNIKGQYNTLKVVDISGRKVQYDVIEYPNYKQLILDTKNKGLLFVIIETDGQKVVKKIVLSP